MKSLVPAVVIALSAGLAGAQDVVIIGEVHDNPTHHLTQAEMIRDLSPSAVVFEMILPEQAAIIAQMGRVDPEAIGWADSGWPAFDIYQPVFDAVGSAPIVAGGAPRAEVRRAISEGAAAVFGPDAARFGLDHPLDPAEQAAREAGQAEAHCDALPPEMLPGMVEAQRFRDAVLARAVLQAVEAHGTPVVLITGNGHARTDWGVPALLALAAPDLEVEAIGQIEGPLSGGDRPFDRVLVAPPVDREDPCAVFSQG
ncbi:ChaN family lipoprotein [Marivivens marinus]|uniref:ChaN family lipoprotein n=1 Tax=Marivivens marinus TaxID=3110173 RepID=UPI003B848FE3